MDTTERLRAEDLARQHRGKERKLRKKREKLQLKAIRKQERWVDIASSIDNQDDPDSPEYKAYKLNEQYRDLRERAMFVEMQEAYERGCADTYEELSAHDEALSRRLA